MTTAADIFAQTVHRYLQPPKAVTAYAPSNIALAKYWGKRDPALNLPLNSSLSISLGDWGTTTSIAPDEQDGLVFNGEMVDRHDTAAQKIWTFVDYFCGKKRPGLRIETENTVPTAAGLASSASGFAALTLALDGAFQTALARDRLSMLARMGSGSATRSFWHGFAAWDAGLDPCGFDSHGRGLTADIGDLRIAVIPVDTGPKSMGSRDGMNHTATTSPLFGQWPKQAEVDFREMERAVQVADFETIGPLAEANALAMHATMMAARPALTYLQPASWQIIQRVMQARCDGLSAYATMDAGANVKVLFLKSQEPDIQSLFPSAILIDPSSYKAQAGIA